MIIIIIIIVIIFTIIILWLRSEYSGSPAGDDG